MAASRVYVADVEADGLLPPLPPDTPRATRVHCIALRNARRVTKLFMRPDEAREIGWEADGSIEDALAIMARANRLIGHNLNGYDIPLLRELYPEWDTEAEVFDTLVGSRLIWPDLKPHDYRLLRRGFPKQLIGKHSLEAWGHRVGEPKIEFGEDFSQLTREMVIYCGGDVKTNARVAGVQLKRLRESWPDHGSQAVELEHRFASFVDRMTGHGVWYDQAKHAAVRDALTEKRQEVADRLCDQIPPFVDHYETPVKKIPRTREIPFNPNSRAHIARWFKETYGWKPTQFTDGGKNPKIDEAVLRAQPVVDYRETADLLEYLMLQKRLGQVETGDKAYIKFVDPVTSRLHGFVNHNGAVSGRCTHSNPNKSNVPSIDKPWGREIRSCWAVPPGDEWYMVGVDASGIEGRAEAHYLQPIDGGRMIEIILTGDLHWTNAQALLAFLGHEEFLNAVYDPEDELMRKVRGIAKTFYYAYLYGAGYQKLGSIVEPLSSPGRQTRVGKALKSAFEAKETALPKLKRKLLDASKKRGDKIRALDGRLLEVRSDHSVLNLLFQSFGAIVMKLAPCLAEDEMRRRWTHGSDFAAVLHSHDETQVEARTYDVAERVGQLGVQAIRDAGEQLGSRCPLDGEAKIGRNWAETH